MIVEYGRRLRPGSLPVFSVDTNKEAKVLIAATCPMTYDGRYFARELAEQQTLENLRKFSDRLAAMYERFQKEPKS